MLLQELQLVACTCSVGLSAATSLSSELYAAPILVVGSVNVDLIMEVHRLPEKGETTISRHPRLEVAVGGKVSALAAKTQQSAVWPASTVNVL